MVLKGLFEESWQGDSAAIELSKSFGVETTFGAGGEMILKKLKNPISKTVEIDFTECPDIAQTFAVMCGAMNIKGTFTGLSTLKIKETDRVAALQNELGKVGVEFEGDW